MQQPVLILGAGINGAAIARELLLNRCPVCLVDTADLASGTTAASSRLIHGGLRYLEFGELGLVRESLAERRRLLNAAPHLVRPLRLYIPITNRGGGIGQAIKRVLGITGRQTQTRRGLWLVQLGLWLYDLCAGVDSLEKRATWSVQQAGLPVDDQEYRWLCSYMDAQVAFPERLVVALLRDCERLAGRSGVPFELFNYCQVRRRGATIEVSSASGQVAAELRPAAIVNATGAWIDGTLQQLNVSSPRLLGGTKGSHLLTFNEPLRHALAGRGIYAEAEDGRPVFVLPLGAGTLVGTTDVVYEAPPETAIASEGELQYLLSTVNSLIPEANLTRRDVHLHYSGVRPLPYAGDTRPAAITRRHFLHEHMGQQPPMYSVVGGKLTTCRSLAEQLSSQVLPRIGRSVEANSRQRLLPGAEDLPASSAELAEQQHQIADELGLSPAQVQAVWALCGTETSKVLEVSTETDRHNLAGTELPVAFVRQVIQQEWVRCLNDLVERRLMLLYDPGLRRSTLRQLATLLVEAGVIEPDQAAGQVSDGCQRLATQFGKQLVDDE